MRVLVSDGALSADLYTGDYTQDPLSGSVRPFAWMSLEALADQGASLPADVVSSTYFYTMNIYTYALI